MFEQKLKGNSHIKLSVYCVEAFRFVFPHLFALLQNNVASDHFTVKDNATGTKSSAFVAAEFLLEVSFNYLKIDFMTSIIKSNNKLISQISLRLSVILCIKSNWCLYVFCRHNRSNQEEINFVIKNLKQCFKGSKNLLEFLNSKYLPNGQ